MYYFEYDNEGFLYQYSESDSENIIMKCIITGSTLIRYEKDCGYEFKALTKYVSNVKFLQRFEAGESWLTVIKNDNENKSEINIDKNYGYNIYNDMEISTPEVKRRIQIENDNIIEFKTNINHNNINHWKKLINL